MKVCPGCSFSNDERFPTCALCNTVIVDVPSTPSANPDDPEHERRALSAKRHRITRAQIRSAGALYALIITLTAMVGGLVFSPLPLALYFISSIVVVVAVARGIVGQFSASFLQGAFSVTLIMVFGPVHPLTFFMLALHIIVPGFLWHWVEMIQSANR